MSLETQRERSRLYAIQWRKANREHVREMNKKYREEHKEQLKDYMRQYIAEHPDYLRDNSRRHREKNLEAERERSRLYYHGHKQQEKERGGKYEREHREQVTERKRRNYWANPEKSRLALRRKMKRYRELYPEETAMRNTVARMFRRAGKRKCMSAKRYVGCTSGFLRNHLEEQFRPGMTWENYGTAWHIDHIVPLSWWDIKNHPEHAMIASHYSNLQPLWGKENMKKGARHCAREAA